MFRRLMINTASYLNQSKKVLEDGKSIYFKGAGLPELLR